MLWLTLNLFAVVLSFFPHRGAPKHLAFSSQNRQNSINPCELKSSLTNTNTKLSAFLLKRPPGSLRAAAGAIKSEYICKRFFLLIQRRCRGDSEWRLESISQRSSCWWVSLIFLHGSCSSLLSPSRSRIVSGHRQTLMLLLTLGRSVL